MKKVTKEPSPCWNFKPTLITDKAKWIFSLLLTHFSSNISDCCVCFSLSILVLADKENKSINTSIRISSAWEHQESFLKLQLLEGPCSSLPDPALAGQINRSESKRQFPAPSLKPRRRSLQLEGSPVYSGTAPHHHKCKTTSPRTSQVCPKEPEHFRHKERTGNCPPVTRASCLLYHQEKYLWSRNFLLFNLKIFTKPWSSASVGTGQVSPTLSISHRCREVSTKLRYKRQWKEHLFQYSHRASLLGTLKT